MSNAVEKRMLSGDPFTYGELVAIHAKDGGDEGKDRLVDKTIQRWRRKGWVEICGRRGKAPLWHLTPLGVDAAVALP